MSEELIVFSAIIQSNQTHSTHLMVDHSLFVLVLGQFQVL